MSAAQVSLQRFSGKHALYLSFAAVYYAGMSNFVSEPSRVLPTLVSGYERRITPRTNLIFQGYVSRSVFQREQTDLSELRGTKIAAQRRVPPSTRLEPVQLRAHREHRQHQQHAGYRRAGWLVGESGLELITREFRRCCG